MKAIAILGLVVAACGGVETSAPPSPCPDGAACDFCGLVGECSEGACVQTQAGPPSCDDGNPCTEDICTEGTCVNAKRAAAAPCSEFPVMTCIDGVCK